MSWTNDAELNCGASHPFDAWWSGWSTLGLQKNGASQLRIVC